MTGQKMPDLVYLIQTPNALRFLPDEHVHGSYGSPYGTMFSKIHNRLVKEGFQLHGSPIEHFLVDIKLRGRTSWCAGEYASHATLIRQGTYYIGGLSGYGPSHRDRLLEAMVKRYIGDEKFTSPYFAIIDSTGEMGPLFEREGITITEIERIKLVEDAEFLD
jgi:hypothetical protein